MRVWWAALVVAGLAACQEPSPLPDMQPGETGRVVKVIDGDALVLNTGQSVRLVSIEAPALRPRGRDPEEYSVESARALEDMVLGREVQLYYPGLTRDRYDRALAHVVTTTAGGPQIWLNSAMVEQGAARVRLYPDTAARGDELLALEAAARANRSGLWAKQAYAIREADRLGASARGFMLVRGRLGPLMEPSGEYAGLRACDRELIGAAHRLEVRKAAGTVCGLPVGSDVLLRGWVTNGRIDLTYPRHLQLEAAPS